MKAIAIDGPAGAGKSTIARRAAEALGFLYVDTGALYRAIGYYAAVHGADTAAAGEIIPLLKEIRLELKFADGAQRVLVNGEDVSEKIRTPGISVHASRVSAIPAVRDFLFGLQREMAENNNVVMDGRDIGTVILPGADVKIFLTASPEERAARRFREYRQRGEQVEYGRLLEEVKARDYADSHREFRPLRRAEDAILIDTTGCDLEEAVQRVLLTIRTRLDS